MIGGLYAAQGKGKTAAAVALSYENIIRGVYAPEETYGNVALNIPDTHVFRSLEETRAFVLRMLLEGIEHIQLIVDEVDRVFPARFFKDKKQTETLIGLWQDEKLFNTILYTAHAGNSVDQIIEDSTQMMMIPEYEEESDLIVVRLFDGLNLEERELELGPASFIFTLYDRWERVV